MALYLILIAMITTVIHSFFPEVPIWEQARSLLLIILGVIVAWPLVSGRK